MKKTLLLLALATSLATTSMAWTNELTALQRGRKGMVSNGFYLFLGFGAPMGTIKISNFDNVSSSYYGNYYFGNLANSYSYSGFNANIEIGNQWMFWRTSDEKFGVGLNVSWLTLGYNAISATDIDPYSFSSAKRSYSQIEFNLLRLGPIASYELTDEAAVDAFVNVAPTVHVGFNNSGNAQAYIATGVLFVPGARFRYKKLALGLEVQIGSVKGAIVYDRPVNPSNDPTDADIRVNVFKPRFTVGFKF